MKRRRKGKIWILVWPWKWTNGIYTLFVILSVFFFPPIQKTEGIVKMFYEEYIVWVVSLLISLIQFWSKECRVHYQVKSLQRLGTSVQGIYSFVFNIVLIKELWPTSPLEWKIANKLNSSCQQLTWQACCTAWQINCCIFF